MPVRTTRPDEQARPLLPQWPRRGSSSSWAIVLAEDMAARQVAVGAAQHDASLRVRQVGRGIGMGLRQPQPGLSSQPIFHHHRDGCAPPPFPQQGARQDRQGVVPKRIFAGGGGSKVAAKATQLGSALVAAALRMAQEDAERLLHERQTAARQGCLAPRPSAAKRTTLKAYTATGATPTRSSSATS